MISEKTIYISIIDIKISEAKVIKFIYAVHKNVSEFEAEYFSEIL